MRISSEPSSTHWQLLDGQCCIPLSLHFLAAFEAFSESCLNTAIVSPYSAAGSSREQRRALEELLCILVAPGLRMEPDVKRTLNVGLVCVSEGQGDATDYNQTVVHRACIWHAARRKVICWRRGMTVRLASTAIIANSSYPAQTDIANLDIAAGFLRNAQPYGCEMCAKIRTLALRKARTQRGRYGCIKRAAVKDHNITPDGLQASNVLAVLW